MIPARQPALWSNPIWRPGESSANPLDDATSETSGSAPRLLASTLDARNATRALLGEAVRSYANRRPATVHIGPSADEASDPPRHLCYVSLNGLTGLGRTGIGFRPERGLPGRDHESEGDESGPALPTIKVVNDYITAWLLSTGTVEALARRAVDWRQLPRPCIADPKPPCGSSALGLFEKSYATAVAGTGGAHAYLDPETFTADTRWAATRA